MVASCVKKGGVLGHHGILGFSVEGDWMLLSPISMPDATQRRLPSRTGVFAFNLFDSTTLLQKNKGMRVRLRSGPIDFLASLVDRDGSTGGHAEPRPLITLLTCVEGLPAMDCEVALREWQECGGRQSHLEGKGNLLFVMLAILGLLTWYLIQFGRGCRGCSMMSGGEEAVPRQDSPDKPLRKGRQGHAHGGEVPRSRCVAGDE